MKSEFYAVAERNGQAIGVTVAVEDEFSGTWLAPAERLNLLHRVAARMQEVAQEELTAALAQVPQERSS